MSESERTIDDELSRAAAAMDPVRTAVPALWPYVETIVNEAFTTGRLGASHPAEP